MAIDGIGGAAARPQLPVHLAALQSELTKLAEKADAAKLAAGDADWLTPAVTVDSREVRRTTEQVRRGVHELSGIFAEQVAGGDTSAPDKVSQLVSEGLLALRDGIDRSGAPAEFDAIIPVTQTASERASLKFNAAAEGLRAMASSIGDLHEMGTMSLDDLARAAARLR